MLYSRGILYICRRVNKRVMQSYPLKVPTDKERVYNQFLTIVNFLIYEINENTVEISPLTNKELEVLASIMYYNDKYRNLPNPERAEYIMSSDIRKKIRDRLNLQANHLNNIVARLRQKYYLGYPLLQNTELSPALDIYLDSNISIEFKLIYENNPEETAEVNRRSIQEVSYTEREDDETSSDDWGFHYGEDIQD